MADLLVDIVVPLGSRLNAVRLVVCEGKIGAAGSCEKRVRQLLHLLGIATAPIESENEMRRN